MAQMRRLRVPFPRVKSVENIYIVSHLDTTIYAQLCSFPVAILTEISKEIAGCTPADAKFPGNGPNKGDTAAAYLRGEHMRVAVMELCGENTCIVELLDYGGLETVQRSSLRPLDEELIEKWPRIAVQVMLKEDGQVIDEDERVLEEIELVDTEERYHLYGRLVAKELGDDAENVKALFPEEDQVTVSSPEVEEVQRVTIIECNEAKGVAGAQLIRSDSSERFSQLNTKLSDEAERSKSLDERPKRGQFVLALSSVGPSWGRALVTAVSDDEVQPADAKVEVEFIDYGTFEEVAISDIKELNADLAIDDAFAILLKFPDLKSVTIDVEFDVRIEGACPEDTLGRTWLATAIDESTTAEDGTAALAAAITPAPDATVGPMATTSTVSVDAESSAALTESVRTLAGSVGSVSGTTQPREDVRDIEEVLIYSWIDSTYGVQLKRYNVETMEEHLAKSYSSPRTPHKLLAIDDFVVIKIEETFCRALVVDIKDDCITALSVDYGSLDDISIENVWPLDPGYASDTPYMSFQCVLEEGQPDLELNEVYSLRILSRSGTSNNTTLFTVTRNDKSGGNMMINGCTVKQAAYPPLELGTEEDLYVGEADPANLTVIPVQLGKYDVDVLCDLSLRLTKQMERGRTPVRVNEIAKGTLVAIRVEDEDSCGYYRAVVCELKGANAVVLQVDYGVVSNVPIEQLALMPDEFVPYPQCGFRCRLSPEQCSLVKEEHFIATNFEKCPGEGIDEYTFKLKSDLETGDEAPQPPTGSPQLVGAEMAEKTFEIPTTDSEVDTVQQLQNRFEESNTSLHKASTDSITSNSSHVSRNSVGASSDVRSETSAKSSADSADDDIATEIQLPALLSTAEKMYIAVDEGEYIGLQFCRVDEIELDNLTNAMTNYYKTRSGEAGGPNVQVGDLVAFCDEGQYYRGEVIEVEGNECKILSCDYASMHNVPRCQPGLIKRFAKLDRLGVRIPKARFTETIGDFVEVVLIKENGVINGYPSAELQRAPPAEVKDGEQQSLVNATNVSETTAETAASESQEILESESAERESKNIGSTEQFVNGDHSETAEHGDIEHQCVATSLSESSEVTTDHARSVSTQCHSIVASAGIGDIHPKSSEASSIALESWFEVFVTWLYSPTKLCVIRNSMTEVSQTIFDKLAALEDAGDLRVIQPSISEKLPASAAVARISHPRTMLYRAKLLALDKSTNLYRVYLADTGELAQVAGDSLFELPPALSLDQMPGLAMILNLRANDNGIRLATSHKQPREILPMFDGILRCRLVTSGADEEICGETSYMASLCNERGDVVPQLMEEGMATFWNPRFVKNTLLLPRNGSELEFVDAQLIRVVRRCRELKTSQELSRATDNENENPSDSSTTTTTTSRYEELRATLQLQAEQERINEILTKIDKASLSPLYTHHVGSPVIVEAHVPTIQPGDGGDGGDLEVQDKKWVRGKVVARHSPIDYTIRLVDYGVDICLPVRQTFRCPAIALGVPEAIAEVTVGTPIPLSSSSSSLASESARNPADPEATISSTPNQALDQLEKRLQEFCGRKVIARRSPSGVPSVWVELFDIEGISLMT